MSHYFSQDPTERTVEVDYNGKYDLTLSAADMYDNHCIYREINLTVVDEQPTKYEVELEVIERFHDEPTPADFRTVPANGDDDKRVVNTQFDKSDLEDLPNVRGGKKELEQLKKPLIEWHEKTPANLNIPY
jgi:hypothetical protein